MAITYATWNPADKGANITLTNGNLTATGAVAWNSVRSTIGVSSGKWYWEIAITNVVAAHMQGTGDASATLTSFVGADTHGFGYFEDGNKYTNNSGAAYGSSYGSVTISVALNMDAGTITFYNAGSSQGQAFSGLSGTFYAMGADDGTDSFTANFGATAFTYSVPSGYNAGLYSGSAGVSPPNKLPTQAVRRASFI